MNPKLHEKSPWNPSVRATKRVRNPLPIPVECEHCGSPVQVAHHKQVYGRSYGDWPWLYKCEGCRAYVGMHPFTNIPLGTLATSEIRQARKHCKSPFESLYKSGRLTRSEAYERLAEKLGIEKEQCHFGWFNVEMCQKAENASRQIFMEIYTS